MNAELHTLWQSGEKPFHSETIYPREDVFVRDVLVAIPSALDHIAQYYPENQLYSLDDWHEHDGLIVPAKPTSLDEIRTQLATAESYVRHHTDATAVYRAIFPDSLDFLLRYSLWEADSPHQDPSDREVHWTFTAYGHDLCEMKKRWSAYNLASESSARYFQTRYAG
ncbi:hypothetical protein Rhal01_02564 [Rubritalea halochordaticola]|uniref:Uncharacterized protein n=1 Tax=Rubritalea halochordaticola TaxID=714537 RepID=A0ABP9V113_9BACT